MDRERCVAILRGSDQRCGRRTRPGTRYCGLHRHAGGKDPAPVEAVAAPMPYSRVLEGSPGEEGGGHVAEVATPVSFPRAVEGEPPTLEMGAASRGLDDEIAILRRLIRKAMHEENLEAARKGIDTLCRALKVQSIIQSAPTDGYMAMLNQALDEMGEELGIEL